MSIYTAKYSQTKEFYGYEYLRSHNSKYGIIGSPYYVGKGKEDRAFSKSHRVKPPKDKTNVQFTPLMNEADAFQWEIFKIYLTGRIDIGTGCLHNITAGGEGQTGRIISLETRQKLCNKKPSEKHKKKTSLALLGKLKTQEHKKNISLGRSGNKHPFFGKKNLAHSKTMKNRIWINNGTIQKIIHPTDLTHYIEKSFVTGRLHTREYLRLQSINIKGRIWINNGIFQKMIFEKDWPSFANQSFSKGMILRKIK